MKTILIHPLAGILSAYGMGLADIRANRQRAIEEPMTNESAGRLWIVMEELVELNRDELRSQGIDPGATKTKSDQGASALCRDRHRDQRRRQFKLNDINALRMNFEAAHKQRFGFITPEKGHRHRGARDRDAGRRRQGDRTR